MNSLKYSLFYVATLLITLCSSPTLFGEANIKFFSGVEMENIPTSGVSLVYNSNYLLFDSPTTIASKIYLDTRSVNEIQHVFISSLNPKFWSGLPDLWNLGWITGREDSLKLYGPIGTEMIAEKIVAAFTYDTEMRIKNTGLPRKGSLFSTVEIKKSSTVLKNDDLEVEAYKFNCNDAVFIGYV